MALRFHEWVKNDTKTRKRYNYIPKNKKTEYARLRALERQIENYGKLQNIYLRKK